MKLYLAPNHCINPEGEPTNFFFEKLEKQCREMEVEIACYSPEIFGEWLLTNYQIWRLKDAQRGIEHEDFLDKVVLTRIGVN